MFHYPETVFNKSTIQKFYMSLSVNAKRCVVYVTGPASIPQPSLALEAET